jgi:hypothetical protein
MGNDIYMFLDGKYLIISLSFLSLVFGKDFLSPFSLLPHASFSLPSPIFLKLLPTKDSCHMRLLQDLLSLEAWILLFSLLSTLLLFGFNQEARVSL